MSESVIGIDIGGTGIKAAAVDVQKGQLASDRVRLLTPDPATPEAVVATAAETIATLPGDGPVGVGLPAAIVDGQVMTAANLAKEWVGVGVRDAFSNALGRPVVVLNDADAAGLAEMRFGAGQGESGVVMVLTLGTGIGSALFIDGELVPNTELGHIEMRGKDAEERAAASVRDRKGLSWKRWSRRLNEYLEMIDRLFWPDLIILGGGISKKPDKFMPFVEVRPRVVPAQLANQAGIVGAALRAAETAPRAAPARKKAARRAPARSRR